MQQDFLLVHRMQNGDEMAMDMFVRKYYPRILQYCRYHCTDKDLAQDLTQDTFEHFFRNLASYRYSGKSLQYLYTIARNLCIDQTRKKREIPMEDITEAEAGIRKVNGVQGEGNSSGSSGGNLETNRTDEKILIEMALGKLSEDLREVVILYYFQELSLKEAAKILQIGLPLAKYRMRRARELLEEYLQ